MIYQEDLSVLGDRLVTTEGWEVFLSYLLLQVYTSKKGGGALGS